jgi:7-carboxy-7-deazaguanine synthase
VEVLQLRQDQHARRGRRPLIRVAETFHSLQGEGPSTGVPAHFLRLQGCDVGCRWCDTRYTWDPAGGRPVAIDAAFAELRALGEAGLLVVTGGEPLVHAGIAELLAAALEAWPRVEVETSGVLPPPLAHARLHYNHSPKLPSATDRWAETWAHAAAFAADPNTTFKLVVGDDPDEADALRLLAGHRLPRERTVLMPEGLTDAAVRTRAQHLAEVCKRENLRFSARLHVWLWGARRGV